MDTEEKRVMKFFTGSQGISVYERMLDISNLLDWLSWAEENVQKTTLQKEQVINLRKMLNSNDKADQDLAIELCKKLRV